MSDKSVVIIGAGLAGLSAGCYGRINGYKTHIFEQHSIPGGVVTSWKRKGYTINYAPHFMWGTAPGESMHQLYLDVGILPACQMTQSISFGFSDDRSGEQLVVPRDLGDMERALCAISPGDSRVISDLIAGARAYLKCGVWDAGMEKPPELSGVWDTAKMMFQMRGVLKYFTGRYAQSVSKYTESVNNSFLRRIVENFFLPQVPAWFLCMILAMYSANRVVLTENSSQEMAQVIENRYLSLGGEITYGALVEEILVEGSRATGVKLSDGRVIRADAVISAADGQSTIYKMLKGRFVDDKIEKRYKSWPLVKPSVTTTFGVKREFCDEPYINTVFFKTPLAVGGRMVDAAWMRTFNYTRRFAPEGGTVIQVDFESEWDFWDELRRTDLQSYRREKERVARELLARLEIRYPGITSQVEMVDVATPYTIWRYTRNLRGAYMGWLPVPEIINERIARTLPGLSNFYMAGQWVSPGGGVVPALFSGSHAIQLLQRGR